MRDGAFIKYNLTFCKLDEWLPSALTRSRHNSARRARFFARQACKRK